LLCANAWTNFCQYPKNPSYFLKITLKSKEEVMIRPKEATWSKLTDAQRDRAIAILVQILLRQLITGHRNGNGPTPQEVELT
jgi:hypothetical protein